MPGYAAGYQFRRPAGSGAQNAVGTGVGGMVTAARTGYFLRTGLLRVVVRRRFV